MAYGPLSISPIEFGDMTPKEFGLACKGYFWERQRLLKDMAWMISQIVTFCKQPTKGGKRSYRPTDFVKDTWTDPRNPFYRSLMDIK